MGATQSTLRDQRSSKNYESDRKKGYSSSNSTPKSSEQINLLDVVNVINGVAEIMKLCQQSTIENLKKENAELKEKFDKKAWFDVIDHKPQHKFSTDAEMQKILKDAQETIGLDPEKYFNICVTGHVKTGKSAFINALRGFLDTHPEAASVGVDETTDKIQSYNYPEVTHVKIYDIPGAGTVKQKSATYYINNNLCAFDLLLIITQDAFGEEEADIATQALRFRQPVAFVRSRCDIVLNNALENQEIEVIDQNTVYTYIRKLSENFIKKIAEIGNVDMNGVSRFFISSRTLRDLMQGNSPKAIYQEAALLDFIKSQSQCDRTRHLP